MPHSSAALPRPARESSGELVRLVAMLMIVTHHWVVHALFPGMLSPDATGQTWDYSLMLGLGGFFYLGVNMFVLLSGWYTIRLKPRSILNLYTICAAYALVHVVLKVARHGAGMLSAGHVASVLLPFSHTGLWFIQCYVALMLLSPLLNAALDSMSRRTLLWALGLLGVMSLWFGYLWNIVHMNSDGYTTLQFVMLYLLGGCLRRCCPSDWLRRRRSLLLWVFVACAALWGMLALLKAWHLPAGFPLPLHPFHYNNPLILTASAPLFLCLMSRSFRSRAVNWLAPSCLAVYIVQESIVKYQWLTELSSGWTPVQRVAALLLLSVGFMLAIMMLDKVRILAMRPLWRFYDNHIDPTLNRGLRSTPKHK